MQNKRLLMLMLSLGLGVVAAFLNWLYLFEKGKTVDAVYYVGIKPSERVMRGDTFREGHFEPVAIPKNRIGSLDEFAIKYEARSSIIGMQATRNYGKGELILQSDLKTPKTELMLQGDERAMWIPVDTRTFVPSLVEPGNLVSFVVSTSPVLTPPPTPEAEDENGTAPPAPIPAPLAINSKVETIGPFRILSLGNRLGSSEVMRAAGVSQVQENVMTISVRAPNEVLEPRAQKLWSLLQSTNFRQVGVLLHPRTETTTP